MSTQQDAMEQVRPSRASSCTGKVSFPSEARALKGTFALFIKKGEMVHPYHCPWCQRWHNGHEIGTKSPQK